jgi:hypothetical protein
MEAASYKLQAIGAKNKTQSLAACSLQLLSYNLQLLKKKLVYIENFI